MKKFIPSAPSPLAMNEPPVPSACTIAGSDPSGGAGIQSDIRTFMALDVWGLSVVTAVTAQNSNTVRDSWPVPGKVVSLQLQTLLEDFEIRAFKTGMLPTTATVEAVCREVPGDAPFVIDPVMISSSGAHLIDDEAIEALAQKLVPRATLITPNLAEAQVLSGCGPIRSVEDMRVAAEAILNCGVEYVLVKGGHLPGETGTVPDLLVRGNGEWTLEGRRLPEGAHGTGCCLSAAITAFLALGDDVPSACVKGRQFLQGALEGAFCSGSGGRIVNPGWNLERMK